MTPGTWVEDIDKGEYDNKRNGCVVRVDRDRVQLRDFDCRVYWWVDLVNVRAMGH